MVRSYLLIGMVLLTQPVFAGEVAPIPSFSQQDFSRMNQAQQSTGEQALLPGMTPSQGLAKPAMVNPLMNMAENQKKIINQHNASMQSNKLSKTSVGNAESLIPSSGKTISRFETNLKKKEEPLPDFTSETPSMVLPEVTTSVRFSSSDLNRISCPSEIKEALTSTEKGVSIKIQGKDAFVKFKVTKRSDGKIGYSTTPAEIFVVCGEDTYTIIAFPQRLPSQLIKLSSGVSQKIEANRSIYAGLPFEKKVLRAIKDVYTEDIPETYSNKVFNKSVGVFRDVRVIHRRSVDIEGEGIMVKEFEVSLKPSAKKDFKLSERHFIKREFAANPVAISIDKMNLGHGDFARVFVVESRSEQPLQVGRGLAVAGGLPSLAKSGDESDSEYSSSSNSKRTGSLKQQMQGAR